MTQASDDHRDRGADRAQAPPTALPVGSQTAARRSGVRLLDVEPDLGAELTPSELDQARREALLTVLELPPHSWDLGTLEGLPGVNGRVYGLLVMSGAIAIEVTLARRACMRLIATGEIVLLDGVESDSIPAEWGWSTLESTRVGVLDRRLLTIARRWPMLHAAILTRASRQTRQAHLQQAISQLPKVEDRLVALFWSLADRLGTVGADGVGVNLALTHAMIAAMIGARRPTVSLALSSLSEQGLITRTEAGWLLSPQTLGFLERPAARERRGGRRKD